MKIFISGGCKNGKSSFAQDIAKKLAGNSKLYYFATMIPRDDEDRLRIKKHIQNRDGMGFETIEVGKDITSCLDKVNIEATFLLDSVTALLQNEMFSPDFENYIDPNAIERTKNSLLLFVKTVKNAVFVSDYIYSDALTFEASTEAYRAGLAELDKMLARECDTVIEVCAGNVILHKGVLE